LSFNNILFADTQELKIAMVLWRGETKAESGFKDGLKELGYSVRYTIFDAEQNRTKLDEILAPGLSHFDYVYSFGTTASQVTRRRARNRIPHIFNIVTAPVESGIVKSMESSGGNVSGVSPMIPT